MAATFDPADGVLLSVEVRNKARALVDPSTLTLETCDPDGAITLYSLASSQLTRDAQGLYSKFLTPPTGGHPSGVWRARWIATNPDLEEPIVWTVRSRSF
jgi:hypothetical protein